MKPPVPTQALSELVAALPRHGWPASSPVLTAPAAPSGRSDAAKATSRIEDLMERGVLDAASEFERVLVDVHLLRQGDAFVGKFTSNLDRLVYPLMVATSRTRVPYVSLDTAWSKDTPAFYDARVHGPLQDLLAAAAHASKLRNVTRKKLRPGDCRAPRDAPGWSETGSRWWCPASRAPAS